MINLELKYIPSLRNILPVPPLFSFRGIARKLGGKHYVSVSTTSILFRFDTIEQAVELGKSLAISSKAGTSPEAAESFPFSAVATLDSTPVAEELWRICPPGHMLFPRSFDYSAGAEWMYGWDIICLSNAKSVLERRAPLRSLLTTGPNPNECFLCGSLEHNAETCPAMFSQGIPIYSTAKLSDIAPSSWLEYLKQATQNGQGITTALDYLKQDMRKLFGWHYASKVCRSTASRLKDLSASPLKDIEISELKEIFIALKSGDLKQVGAAIRHCEGMEQEKDQTGLAIMKGFYHISTGFPEKALEAWWGAEREAGIPSKKAYAALLQARQFMISSDREHAREAVIRALKADKSPQTIYWHMTLDAIYGNGNAVSASLGALAPHPSYISSALAEPLLIGSQTEVEETFSAIWKRQEEAVLKEVSSIEALLKQARTAFGPEVIKDAAIRLRDWRGRWSEMGYRPLLSSREFLDGLKTQVITSVNRKFRQTLSRFPEYERRCRSIVSKLPRSPATSSIRKKAVELAQRIRETGSSNKHRKLEGLEGFREEVDAILSDYEELNEMYQEYLDKAWQKKMVLKLLIYGTILSVTTWSAIYIYETWFK